MKTPTYRTVLNPNWKWTPQNKGRIYEEDYVLVPRLATVGTFPVKDMIDLQQLGALAAFTNKLKERKVVHVPGR